MIYFNESDHTYRLDDPIKGELCISATTFIGLFKADFDSEFWSYYTGLRYALNLDKDKFSQMLRRAGYKSSDRNGKTTQENIDTITIIARANGITEPVIRAYQKVVKYEWDSESLRSQIKGTSFHNYKEGEIYKDSGLEYEEVFAKVKIDSSDLTNLHDEEHITIIPELRMFNREYLLSGSADMVFIYPDKKFSIDDWKTNKKIDQTNKYQKMKGPLKHLDDCNYNHYRLQVSLYAWILEQHGYTPNNLKFTHVKIDENNNIIEQTEYHTRYLKKEIESMLRYYKDNKEELLTKLKK